MYSSGESIAYCPYTGDDAELFAEVVHHEGIGHGFGKLLDEYIYYKDVISSPYVSQFNAARRDGLGFNLTLNSSDIPWSHFLGKPNYSMVGVFEGGYFLSRGVWRAEQNSCMNNNVPYFNGPSRELIVKRIKSIAGEAYSWDEFVARDKYEPVMQTKAKVDFVPLAPPVIIKGSPNYKR